MKPLNLVVSRAAETEARALPVPVPASAAHVLVEAAACVDRGVRGAMATVIARHGSVPGTPGQKLFLGKDGTCFGSVGGGALEREVIETLGRMLEAKSVAFETRTIKLGAELGMCCGGRVDVFVEVLDALVPCLLVGGGHVASAVAPLLTKIGFAVTIVDEREAWGDKPRPEGVQCVTGDFDDVGKAIDRSGVCLVMTHDHALDQKAIEWALSRKFAFVGGVGSRAKAERTRQRLEAKGFSEEDRARVRMPIGLDIGARLPEEIAVAIAAEMVRWRTEKK